MIVCFWFNQKSQKQGYIYHKNFLSVKDFNEILKMTKVNDKLLSLSFHQDSTVNRCNLNLNDLKIYNIIKKYENKIQEMTENNSIYLARNFPIQYRKYIPGSFMKLHTDTQLYKIPQYECILTLSNNSDCLTTFYLENEKKSIWTEPNSIVILKANGIPHEVQKVTRGERYFLKFIFTETDERLS